VRNRVLLTTLVAVLCWSATELPAVHLRSSRTPMQVDRFGVYVVVDQLDRSAAFYGRVFSVPPEVAMPALVGFNLGGAFFGLVAKDVYAPHVRRGDNTIPYIKLQNVEAFFEHVKQVAPESLVSAQVSVEGVFRFFRLKDPDGNVLEFFSITTSTP